MLADPAFRDAVCAAMRVLRHEVSVDGAGPGMRVVVDQTQPARGIPPFAQKLVGEEIRIVQTERWSDARHADLEIEVPGKPGTMSGTIVLAPSGTGTGTVQSVTGEVKVKVPLVGGKLEGLVGDLLHSALTAEQRAGRAWLAG